MAPGRSSINVMAKVEKSHHRHRLSLIISYGSMHELIKNRTVPVVDIQFVQVSSWCVVKKTTPTLLKL
jgi:hypothetical protein